jgi:hypothetical protein
LIPHNFHGHEFLIIGTHLKKSLLYPKVGAEFDWHNGCCFIHGGPETSTGRSCIIFMEELFLEHHVLEFGSALE